jgi:hypothetical protein
VRRSFTKRNKEEKREMTVINRKIKLEVADWVARICIVGAVICFILEIMYGEETYMRDTIGFIFGWLTANEIRIKERFDEIKEELKYIRSKIKA